MPGPKRGSDAARIPSASRRRFFASTHQNFRQPSSWPPARTIARTMSGWSPPPWTRKRPRDTNATLTGPTWSQPSTRTLCAGSAHHAIRTVPPRERAEHVPDALVPRLLLEAILSSWGDVSLAAHHARMEPGQLHRLLTGAATMTRAQRSQLADGLLVPERALRQYRRPRIDLTSAPEFDLVLLRTSGLFVSLERAKRISEIVLEQDREDRQRYAIKEDGEE